MNQHAAIVPDRTSIVEQWFRKMEASLARLSVLAGSGALEDIKLVMSHVRAARRERAERPIVDLRAELQTAVEEVQEVAVDMRQVAGVLRAELYHGGPTPLTDWLAIDSEMRARRAESVAAVSPTLKLIDALLQRVDALQAFPHELDALLKSTADVPADQKQRRRLR